MWIQLYAVARNAMVESVRQRFFAVWLGLIGFLLVINPFLAAYTFSNDDALASDMGLSMLLIGGLVLAAFVASGVIGREIENKTALTVVSKPLARPVFVIGKYLGVLASLVVAWWIWTLLHLMSLRQGAFSTVRVPWDRPVIVFGLGTVLAATMIAISANYFFRKPFTGAWARWLSVLLPLGVLAAAPFNHEFATEPNGELFDRGQWLAVFLILQATMVFAAVAVAASTRLGQSATLVVMLVVFFLGITSDYAFGRRAAEAAEAGDVAGWAKIGYAAAPNFQFHWLGDAISQGTIDQVGFRFIALVSLYTLCLVIGVLGLAVALFQTRNAS
ncbi:MAG: hypothetical protein AAGI46_08690 [Planctomycetota bacterium]